MIVVHIPIDVKTEFVEGLVERNPVTIPLGVDDDAILVEEYAFELSHG
jgi:hypothetical protein